MFVLQIGANGLSDGQTGSDGVPYEKFADGTSKNLSDEIPFDIPESWEWVKLGDVFNHNTGKALNRNNAEGVLREYITTSNVYWDEFKLDELKHMPFTDEELNKCTVQKGDLLVCEGGDIGRAAIWNFNKEVCIQNHLHRLRGYSEVCVPYFCFVLRLYKATNRLQGKGIGLQGFSSGMLHNLIVPLPPLAEQKRVVAKVEELFAYADQIGSASEEITKTAQRLDKKILDLAIRGKLVPQDPNDEPARDLVKRIEEQRQAKTDGKKSRATASHKPTYEIEPPFAIPESWQWVRLGSLIQIIAGVSYQKDEVTTSGVRILRGGNIKEDARIYLHNDDVFLPATYTDEDTSIKTGDIVIVASTGSSTVIGRPAVATETMLNVQIGAFLRIVRSVDDSITSWLPVVFLGNYYRSHIRSKSKGTNIKNLKAEYLTELSVPLPPLAEQKRIVAKIEELRAMTHALTT